MISEEEFIAAEEYSRKIRESGLYAVAAHYDTETNVFHVVLKSSFTISFPKERSQVTAFATDQQLQEITIGAAGRSIDFPGLDEGLTVEGMLAGHFGNRHWEQAWAEAHREPQAA